MRLTFPVVVSGLQTQGTVIGRSLVLCFQTGIGLVDQLETQFRYPPVLWIEIGMIGFCLFPVGAFYVFVRGRGRKIQDLVERLAIIKMHAMRVLSFKGWGSV